MSGSSGSLRRVEEDPDRATRSTGRYVALLAVGLLGAIGAVLAVAGAVAPLESGESRSALPIAMGSVMVVLAGAYVVAQQVPSRRGPWPAAEQRADAVALPVRAGHRAAGAVACLAVVAVGILTIVVGSPGGRLVGVLVAIAGIAAAVSRTRSPVAVVLDPAGVVLPGAVRPRRVSWGEIREVAVDGGWLPSVVLGLRGSRVVTFRLAGQAWPPSAILAVLDHYRSARGRDERDGLTDVASVDRFRTP